jgi:hypothetical protein
MNGDPIDTRSALRITWEEGKQAVGQLIPYALIVWLIWTMQGQHIRLIDQHIEALQVQAAEQFTVLSAIRDTLTQRGLVVPPFGETR